MRAHAAGDRPPRFAVVGQIGRDLVLRILGAVASAEPATVSDRGEMLGGKGANQAVALRQLGGDVALVGVVGDDGVGSQLVERVRSDGIDTCGVVRRGRTALLVDIVAPDAQRRILEHVPDDQRISPADVEAAAGVLRRADVVCVQLQQDADAVTAAARIAKEAGAVVAADGSPSAHDGERELAVLDVLRANAEEAGTAVGFAVRGPDSAEKAARMLLSRGPAVVAVAVPGVGDVVVWRTGSRMLPFQGSPVVDRTGAGDAFFAGLVTGIAHGWPPEQAGVLAASAAGQTVRRLGGRPDLAGLAQGRSST